jgi:phage replication initiation protein
MERAIIDWCQGTFKKFKGNPHALVHLWMCHWLGDVVGEELGHGIWGYEKRTDFYKYLPTGKVMVGMCAAGGNKDTVLFQLNGHGCALVEDWSEVHRILAEHEAKLTRVDVAVDQLQASYNLDQALEWYGAGEFVTSGSPPKHNQVGDWAYHRGDGRTLYVGSKASGKEACIYEKGKQLGDRWSRWVRFEVRWLAHQRVIPQEVLLKPTQHFAGAYPACERVISVDASLRIETLAKEGEISLQHLLKWQRQAYGRVVYVQKLAGITDEEIVSGAMREGIPKRLEKAQLAQILKSADAVPIGESYEHANGNEGCARDGAGVF